MPAKKAPRLRRATQREAGLVALFCSRAGFELEDCARNLFVLEVPGGSYYEVFDPPPEVLDFAARYLGMTLYSLGYYVGLLDVERRRFRPSLPLAHRLAPLCGRRGRCCVLNERGERIFLYGKPVSLDLVVSAPASPGPCLVTNRLGEALGWGVLPAKSKKGGARPRLEPVIDLGWYLRRGG